ncbi:hypothetical protein PTSG_05601 [Salpingoeca rosetta]|uniref:CHY-type domain-containing protein n=1 Tax=Salpingoeca rosetta (strain ATCC 50818 / BSB-021) TaxID=946362 RepID=F2UBN9_SALR5|nr:uncharacterized protein PTSG_05601 [Salpingoeca rosetta]EGD73905.1 hypothetical protein PTSG_05601 [Salpingoeca rosetta]|eukprot:XP_004993468.1 hypothetical protein PTSG_05601 [Salpingoeca rosetta]
MVTTAKATTAVRAGGRRVAVKRPTELLAKKRAATAAAAEKKKKEKLKKKNKDTDENDPTRAGVRVLFKTVAIGSAIGVVLLAAVGAFLVYTGATLPDPKHVFHAATQAALDRLTVINIALGAAVITAVVFALKTYWRHQERKAREEQLNEQRRLEQAHRALQRDRKREQVEARKRRRELEQQDLINKGKLIAELDEKERQRQAEYEQQQKKLEEQLRKEAELERQIAAETRMHQYKTAALAQMQREEEMQRQAIRKGKVIPGYNPALDDYSSDDDSTNSDDDDDDDGEDRRAPVEIELNPQKRGFEIDMTTKLWWNIATLQANTLNLRMLCNRCATPFDASLSGVYESECSLAKRCSKCKAVQRARFRPQIVHEGNKCLGYVDTEECQVQDVPSVLFNGVCMGCSSHVEFKTPAVRARRCESTCFRCHQKLAVEIDVITTTFFTADGAKQRPPAPGSQMLEKGGPKRRNIIKSSHVISAGQPLPSQGACQHFRKSYKWFRFPCCGLAFPCPVCHEQSGCEGAIDGKHASRVICGKCSQEQSVDNKQCSNCSTKLTQKNVAGHWAGGSGTRDTSKLSNKERKKNQGVSRSGVKKTQSKKSQRVGQKGKANREDKKKHK